MLLPQLGLAVDVHQVVEARLVCQAPHSIRPPIIMQPAPAASNRQGDELSRNELEAGWRCRNDSGACERGADGRRTGHVHDDDAHAG